MLKQKLQKDQITALKAKDSEKVTTLRYILSQIQNKEIDKKAQLSDDETVLVIRKIVKELNESLEAAKKANRQDLVDQNQKQLEFVSPYLPQEISDEELSKELEKLIKENQDLYKNKPQAVIGIAVKALKNKAAPSRIAKLLQTLKK